MSPPPRVHRSLLLALDVVAPLRRVHREHRRRSPVRRPALRIRRGLLLGTLLPEARPRHQGPFEYDVHKCDSKYKIHTTSLTTCAFEEPHPHNPSADVMCGLSLRVMGDKADPEGPRGKFYLNTNAKSPMAKNSPQESTSCRWIDFT